MKKKVIIINFLMSLMVLSAMLFQTVHSYEHVLTQLTEKRCEHHTSANQKEITHSHSVDPQCPLCHFAFSTFIPNSFQSLSFEKLQIETPTVYFYTKSVSTFFKGCLFALRAPPAL